MNIKNDYISKKKRLKRDIMNLFYSFQDDTGCTVMDIITDTEFGILTFDILTDIEKED